MIDLPEIALSVRQPWTWAIIFGRKDIENRSWSRLNPGLTFRGRVAIHAGVGMTRAEYEDAAETIVDIGLTCPPPAELVRGAIIGSVDVVDVVKQSDSPWFCGPLGLVLRDPLPCTPVAAVGQLGFFAWQPAPHMIAPHVPAWMANWGKDPERRPLSAGGRGKARPPAPSLFE